MDPEEYVAPEAGQVVRAEAGHWAFIPAPLPPEIKWDTELVLTLSKAGAALGRLNGFGSQLPDLHLLIDPYARREAVLSSRIEGTQTSLSEVFLDEIEAVNAEDSRDDVREVRNYVRAREHGMARLKDVPLSLALVREIHEILMDGVGGERSSSEFRRTQNWIGGRGSTIDACSYVPPPPEEMLIALSEWERFLAERDTFPDLIQCALVHEQFEAIHPFLDGNGRIGRLLIPLFLVDRQKISQPLLYLSEYFEANRVEYYDTLQAVRTHADWRRWLMFFLKGVEQVATSVARHASELAEMRQHYRAQVTGKPKSLALVDELFRSPVITAVVAARSLGVTDPTARKAITSLEAVGLLEEFTGRNWGKVWIARPVMEVLERPL